MSAFLKNNIKAQPAWQEIVDFSSNIPSSAGRFHCPSCDEPALSRSKALGLARHRLAVMREGWLTAVRAPSSAVHGVMWELALSGIAALDRYENFSQGLYVKLTQAVIAERGPKQAIVYFGVNAGPGAARPAYLAEVLAAARSWPLPAEGVEALERLARP